MNTDLNHLCAGQKAVVQSIEGDEALHHRLQALGFRAGKDISVIRKGRFDGPLQVRIGMTDVILRRSDAAKIKVLMPA